MCALGQPEHIPVNRTRASLPLTLTNSMSPPSACISGRIRSSTASTLSLETMFASFLRGTDGIPSEQRVCHEATRLFSGKGTRIRAGTDVAFDDGLGVRGIFRGGAGLFALGCLFQAEFFDSIPNLVAIQSQQGGCLRVIPASAGQGLDDEIAFNL